MIRLLRLLWGEVSFDLVPRGAPGEYEVDELALADVEEAIRSRPFSEIRLETERGHLDLDLLEARDVRNGGVVPRGFAVAYEVPTERAKLKVQILSDREGTVRLKVV